MAEAIGSAAGGHPDLNLTVEEKRVYGELLREADPDGFGAVSGDVAVKFFERTRLPADVLGQIWQIADTENRGFLTPSGFGVVLRLIGHAQAGRVPSTSLAPQAAPLPKFDSNARQPPPAAAPLAAQVSGTPSSPTSSGPGPIRVPALSPEKVNEYSTLFEKSGAENGALSGMVAKQIFERARLPNELLGRIWMLADTQGRGSLDVTEFIIAMHLLASCKSGAMRGVPNTLPPGLYDAAARRPPPRMAGASPRPGSATGFPSAIPPQFSGSGARPQSPIAPNFTGYDGRPQSPITRAHPAAPLSAQSTGEPWAVTAAQKVQFDSIFASVDRQGLGYITGEQAVSFFTNARLPEDTLAQIWDLADINSEGRLNKDEFAVAMHLIRQQRGTRDGRGNLPSSLPPALVPPSMRKQVIPPSQPTAPAFENATITQPRSAADDLFGLDVLSSPTQTSAPAQPASIATQQTGAQGAQSSNVSDTGFFGSTASPITSPAAATAPSSVFQPFKPTSHFGQSQFGQSPFPQPTGSPAPTQSRAIPVHSNNEDLLGDTDANVSSKLTNETAELGNLSNQVGNLSREMTDLQGKRTQADQELSQNAQQKQTFETRLSQLRSAFDTEAKEYRTLQERLTTSRNEIKRLQQDMAMVEGNHADTKRQHEQLRAAYEADQQENNSLKEKMRQINMESEQLKPQMEKLKSDARQQKGLVAINKKQLNTSEEARDRLHAEIAAAQKDIEEANREIEETNRQVEASKLELEEAHKQVAAKKKELEEASARAAASKKELEETRALPKPTMPVQAIVASSVPASSATSAAPAIAHETARNEVPASPPLASPTPSTISNPFMRRDGSTFFSPPMGSPEPTHDHSAFDSIFGPSFGAAASTAPDTSFRSETPPKQVMPHGQSLEREIHTPTSSTAPDIIEPPAPPTAKQITSDALPFRAPLERTESMTSSVKVMPPASRLSPADTPRAMTPGFSTPGTDKHSSDIFGASPDEEQESVRRTLPRTDTHEKTAGIPGAFPMATPRSETPGPVVDPTAIALGTGAAVAVAGAGLAAAVTSQADEKPKETKAESPAAETSASKANNFDEYFGGPAHQRTASEQVKDFDDAFASMKPGTTKTNGTTTKASNQEFPDIQEFDDNDDDDDDSSVYSEETPLGFDDDFNAKPATTAPTASGPATSSIAAGKQPEIASAVPSHLQPRVQADDAVSITSSLPGIDSQTSPPTYETSVPADNPTHFPREYKGLIPERENPTSPPLPTAGGSSHPGPNPSGTPPAYGPEAARSQDEAIAKTRSSSAAKPTAFDFDSVFAGMGPAQVHEEDSDDETAFGSHRNHIPEFDPTFGSPAQSRAGTVASVTQSPMTTHDAVTNGSSSNTGTKPQSFFGFNDSVVTAAPTQTASGSIPTISHDWDALFAPLSSAPATDANDLAKVDTQRTEISPEVNARTSATEISGTSTPIPTGAVSTAPIPQAFLKPERPQPGRALSTGTEHDDPILKQLTSMGWSRNESLAALEKYDYNLDKAMDFLTFRS